MSAVLSAAVLLFVVLFPYTTLSLRERDAARSAAG